MKQVRLLLSLFMLLPLWAAAGWGAEGFPALTSDNEVTFFYVVDKPVTEQYANAKNAHEDQVADASKLTYYLWWWGNGSSTDGYSWPGKPMTLESYTLNGKTVYKGTFPGTAVPSNFIISVYENDKLSNTEENNQEVARPINGAEYRNHYIYVNNQPWEEVTMPKTYTISVVDEANWGTMALYEYNEHDGFKTELFGGWPGTTDYTTATTADDKTVYQFTFTSSVGVHSLIANNNNGGLKTSLTGSLNGGFYSNSNGSQVSNPLGTDNHIITLPVSESIGLGNEVIYQLNVDAFTTEGTLAAATAQIDYLKNLGVDIIYLMPIHERGNSNSPYAVKDYYSVKTSYGTLTDLQAFVNAAHAKGMKVWLDWVANHTATEANWVTSNPDYYATSGGNKIHPNGYGDVWQLDLTKDAVQTAMIDAMKYWVANADIDGFRCDMVQGYGGYLPAAFWTKAISQLKTEKSTLRFLAETDFANHNGSAYFANGWNYDYAWNFQEQLAGKQNNHPTSAATLKGYCQTLTDTQGSDYGNLSRMVYLTSHDVNWNIDENAYGNVRRTIQEMYGNNRCVFTALEFTLYGMPLIFNGQERNVNEAIDYFGTTSGHQKVNWNNPNNAMSSLVKELVELKHTHPALNDYGTTKGSIRYIDAKNGDTANDNVLAYMREKGDDKVLVVLNLNGEAQTVDLIGINPGTWTQTVSGSYNYTTPASDDITLTTSTLNATVPANGYVIYTLKEATNYTEGWYLDCNVDWDSQKINTTKSTATLDRGTGKGSLTYDVYTKSFTKSEAAYYLNNNDATTGTFYFKFREYYNSNGFVVKNPARVCAEANEGFEFNAETTRANDRWLADGADGANESAFRFNVSDDYDRYTIKYYRCYGQDEFVEVTFDNINYGEGITYTLNCYGDDGQQWGTSKYVFTKTEEVAYTKDGVTAYKYSYTIPQEDFKKYGSADEQYNDQLFFKIRPLENGEPMKNHLGTENVFINAADEEGYVFTLPAKDEENPNECLDAHWDSDEETGKAFLLKWQPDMKEYVITVWIDDVMGTGRTHVQVEFVKAFRFKGVDVATEVPATGKRVYLYNLGTGQFIYSGGAWGTAGVTKFEDYGLPMTISKTTNTQYAPDSDDRTFYTLTTDFGGVGGSNRFAIQPGDDSYGSSNNGLVPNGGVWVDQSEGVRWVLVPETDKELTHGANVYRIYYAYDQDYMINPGSKKDPGDDEYQVWLYAAANDALNEQANGTLVRYRKIPTGTTNHQHDNESDIPAATSDDYLYHLWTLVTEDDLWAAFTEAAKGNRAFADATYLMKNPAIVRNMNFGETNIGGKPYIENGWTIDNTIVKPDNEKDGGNHQLDFIGTTNGDNVANYPDALGFSSNLYPMAYWNYLFGGNGEIKQTIEVPAITGWYSFKCNGMNVDPGSNAEMYIKINGTEYGTQKLAANAEDTNSLPVNGTMNVADATAAADARIRAAIVGKNLDDIKNYIDTDNYNALNAWVPNMTEPQLADWYDNGQQLSWNGYDIPGLNKQTNGIYTSALAKIVNELTAGNNTNMSVDARKAQELYLGKVAYQKLQYTNELLFYVGDADIAGKEKVEIEVGFRKPASDPTYAFASFDDVHVTYLGEISFVMDEDYTETIGADYLANEGHENIEVYLKRKFAVGHWNTLVMPIDVDRKTMLQMFGQSVQVAQAIGLKSDKPNVIAFELIDYENGTQYINDDAVIIKACTQENCEDGTGKVLQRLPYYLVKPVTNLGIASRSSKIYDTQLHEHVNLVSDDAENHYLPMGKRNMSTVDGEWYNPVWPWSSYTSLEAGSENYQHNDLQYKATYITTTITDTDFYVIATDDNMYHLTQATLIKGFRFWITDVNNPTGESKLTFMLYQPGDLEEPEEIEIPELTDEPTGIRILNAADAQGEAPRYNLAGQRVGKDYKGVVVVNGKKMLVK